MQVKKKFFYNEEPHETALVEYSKFKFGEVHAINYFAGVMSKIIQKEILNGKKYVLYVTNKFPTKSYYKKNSLLLAEKISKILNLPLIIGEYKYNYLKDDFYDNQIERKIHQPRITTKDKLKYGGAHIFLMVDDSLFTGTSLKVSLNELQNVANEILFFSIINLNKCNYSEKDVNNMGIKKIGMQFIIEIINHKNYVFTTHMLRAVEELTKQKLLFLFKKIDGKRKRILLKSFKEYIEKDLL